MNYVNDCLRLQRPEVKLFEDNCSTYKDIAAPFGDFGGTVIDGKLTILVKRGIYELPGDIAHRVMSSIKIFNMIGEQLNCNEYRIKRIFHSTDCFAFMTNLEVDETADHKPVRYFFDAYGDKSSRFDLAYSMLQLIQWLHGWNIKADGIADPE